MLYDQQVVLAPLMVNLFKSL